MAKTARRAAWETLAAYLVADPTRARLGSRGRPFPPPDLGPEARARARTLAEGAVKRLRMLDAVLVVASGGRKPRPHGLRAALLLAAHELLLEPDVARHAVVHEAVDLARVAAGEGGARFANAILRRIAERPAPEAWIEPPGESVEPARLGVWYSYPDDLVRRWVEGHGAAVARQLLELGNRRAHLCLRANVGRLAPEELAQRLLAEGIVTRPGFHPRSLLVDGHPPVLETAAFRQGLFAVQDTSQIEVVDLLDLQPAATPGPRVLDLCAAPGTKTAAIAEALAGNGDIVASDADLDRLAGLPAELLRLGLGAVRMASAGDLRREAAFDRILVDAPCSNTGVLSRRAEARWRFTPAHLEELVAHQRQLLRQAAALLRPGGRLVYATCSIEPEENEALAQGMAEELGLRLLSAERVLPERDVRDGGGVAVLCRPAAATILSP